MPAKAGISGRQGGVVASSPLAQDGAGTTIEKGGWVYIVTNKPHGVLYTGVTADLPRRIWQHRDGSGSTFARRYNCKRLVYAEPHESIEDAIAREKAIKAWPRLWKLRLIQEHNPHWDDLFEKIIG